VENFIMGKSVTIDYLPESAKRYPTGYAVVAVDVIRATSVAITAVELGRRCFPVATLDGASQMMELLASSNPMQIGELGGHMPYGFNLNNSPVALTRRTDVERPAILLSSSGSRLMSDAAQCEAGYAACFRNFAPTARHLAKHHDHVALLGAGSRGEFREEDQICCAWMAEILVASGFEAENRDTELLIKRWSGASPQAARQSKSADFLIRTSQVEDLDFILTHINDIPAAFKIEGSELIRIPVDMKENGIPYTVQTGNKTKS
jgi:2-phosphosulfolactate phosphatase